MSVVPVKNANRMMAPASLLDNGIELSFADGARGLIPYADVPEVKVRAGISGLELPDPYEMALHTAEGDRVEVSWAFARGTTAAHRTGRPPRPWPQWGAGPGRGHRAGYAGAAGEWGAEPQVQDPDGPRSSIGDRRPGAAVRAGAAPAAAAGKPSIDTDAEGRCQQATGSSRRPWKPASGTCEASGPPAAGPMSGPTARRWSTCSTR